MDKEFKVTRKQIIQAAESMLGLPFVHQGRCDKTGVDCVGLLVVMGQKIQYPKIVDAEAYRRIPSAEVIREIIELNCDEIPLEDAKEGDIYLMRLTGLKPRHAALIYHDERRPDEPMLLHATKKGVRIEPKSKYPESWFVRAYRVRGLVD